MPVPDHGIRMQAWVREKGGPKQRSEIAMIEEWKEYNRSIGVTPLETAYKGGYLQLHEKLTKAESSVLTQARTGKIGLRAFLFRRRYRA